MTLILELPPDLETALVAVSEAEGLSLETFVQQFLQERFIGPPVEASPADLALNSAQAMTPAQRAAAVFEFARTFPWTPPLSDEAISRESLYGDRG